MGPVLETAGRALLGGIFVVAFAAVSQGLSPKRLSGVLSAGPSIALGSLTLTALTGDAAEARAACTGMQAGAVGFVVYALLAPPLMRRTGTLTGAVIALAGWAAAAAAVLPFASASPVAKAVAAAVPGRRRPRPRIGFSLARVRGTPPHEWTIRFAFGAATSLGAALLELVTGPVIGGAFLAFPATLLASLTLIREEEGRSKARDDARGALWGAIGLVAFAVVAVALLGALPPIAALALAALAWAAVAATVFAAVWLLGGAADEHAHA